MAFPIDKCGMRTLFDLGQLVLAVYLISILFVGRDSTETMLPQSMKKLERLGCNKEAVRLLMNMAGTAICMTIGILMFW